MKVRQREMAVIIVITCIVLGFIFLEKNFFYAEAPEDWKLMPLVKFQSPLVLRVAYANNSRFKSLSHSQITRILNKSSQLVSQHFSIELTFEREADVSVQNLFSDLPYIASRHQTEKIIYLHDEKQTVSSFNRIRESISLQIQHSASSEQSQIDYAIPYLLKQKKINNLNELTAELTKTLTHRFQFWQQEKAQDSMPILDGSPYNQWILWDILGYGNLPYDIVITNQLVASIEENGMPVHTSLRGGISGGSMAYSKQGRLGGYVFVSAFQMINDNPLLNVLREDENYTEQQIIDYTAATITHELGHLLFHYAHPFNAQSCIMNPTPMLRYRQWYEQLDAQACQLLSSPMLQVGAAKLTYNVRW